MGIRAYPMTAFIGIPGYVSKWRSMTFPGIGDDQWHYGYWVPNDDHYRVLSFAGGIMCEGGVNPEKKSKYM